VNPARDHYQWSKKDISFSAASLHLRSLYNTGKKKKEGGNGNGKISSFEAIQFAPKKQSPSKPGGLHHFSLRNTPRGELP